MTFIIDNFPYFALAALLIIFILAIVLVIQSYQIKGYFYSRKFRIKSTYEINPSTLLDRFRVDIFNNNINDMRIMALGFVYQSQVIDYYQLYLSDNNLPLDSSITIASRGYLDINVDQHKLYEIIKSISKGKFRVSKVCFFVTDSLGYTSKVKTKTIHLYFKKRMKQDKRVHDGEQKAIRMEARAVLKAKRKAVWDSKKAHAKQKWNSFWASFQKTKKQ